ncbi:hypothetical protein LT493_28665 [Streptomyces tricolor]|nr:hypothetical protein [Streptomyces tricolor]
MRGLLTSCPGVSPLTTCSIGVAFAAVVALAAAPPASAGVGRAGQAATAGSPAGPAVPGSTRSLPLAPLPRERVAGAAPEQGLYRTGLARFALVGVVWDDPDTELHGRAQVRTRSAATGEWSGWQDLETHHADDGADPGAAERSSGRVRGATAPLWVGASDGVDVRVRAEGAAGAAGVPGRRAAGLRAVLPSGLRLELVDPGEGVGETGAREAGGGGEDRRRGSGRGAGGRPGRPGRRCPGTCRPTTRPAPPWTPRPRSPPRAPTPTSPTSAPSPSRSWTGRPPRPS